MIAALRRLSAAQAQPNKAALAAPATAALWFTDPLAGTWLSRIFSTHPLTEKRIVRLEAMNARKL